MKLSIFILSLFSSLCVLLRPVAADDPQCGIQADGALCRNNLCCSYWGFCGTTEPYCGDRCQSQCWSSPPPQVRAHLHPVLHHRAHHPLQTQKGLITNVALVLAIVLVILEGIVAYIIIVVAHVFIA